MTDTAPPPQPAPRGLARAFAWQRLVTVVLASLGFGLMHDTTVTPAAVWIARDFIVAASALCVFALFEQWPQRLPAWLSRWALQVVGILLVLPFAVILAYGLTDGSSFHQIMANEAKRHGFYSILGPAILFAPWFALASLMRQREAAARQQAHGFELQRVAYERQALDARLRLLQAQVQPHFLFNTLANVRALVRAGSPEAPAVLDSLIAYLRAAMPSLDDTRATVDSELQLVRAYLDLMRMRMPDRLQFSVQADDAARGLRMPPMALLTLVENAVRHGIDPSELGGRIDVTVNVRDGRCIARVADTGVGLQETGVPPGTGLDTLRERMRLAFTDAHLRLAANFPEGTCAELEFPAQQNAPHNAP